MFKPLIPTKSVFATRRISVSMLVCSFRHYRRRHSLMTPFTTGRQGLAHACSHVPDPYPLPLHLPHFLARPLQCPPPPSQSLASTYARCWPVPTPDAGRYLRPMLASTYTECWPVPTQVLANTYARCWPVPTADAGRYLRQLLARGAGSHARVDPGCLKGVQKGVESGC
jgi:hypothetical protein